MANTFFQFRQFTVKQQQSAMKVTTDGCLFGAWAASQIQKSKLIIERILDVGTGTGLLSLMVAQQCNAAITAVEVDAAAADEANKNFESSPWSQRLQVLQGDVLQLDLEKDFDCIICNPPFYEQDLKGPHEGRNTAHHSHQLQMEKLVSLLRSHISKDGVIYLLLPFKRMEELKILFAKNQLFLQHEVEVAPAHRPTRWMVALGKSKPSSVQKTKLVIKENEGYSAAFKKLLQDYYLKL